MYERCNFPPKQNLLVLLELLEWSSPPQNREEKHTMAPLLYVFYLKIQSKKYHACASSLLHSVTIIPIHSRNGLDWTCVLACLKTCLSSFFCYLKTLLLFISNVLILVGVSRQKYYTLFVFLRTLLLQHLTMGYSSHLGVRGKTQGIYS